MPKISSISGFTCRVTHQYFYELLFNVKWLESPVQRTIDISVWTDIVLVVLTRSYTNCHMWSNIAPSMYTLRSHIFEFVHLFNYHKHILRKLPSPLSHFGNVSCDDKRKNSNLVLKA